MTSYSPYYITWLWSLLSCGVLLLRAGKLTSQMPRKSKKKVVETVPLKKIWWSLNISLITLPETNSSHLNMDAWKIKVPFGGGPIFRGKMAVSFRKARLPVDVTSTIYVGVLQPSFETSTRGSGLQVLPTKLKVAMHQT